MHYHQCGHCGHVWRHAGGSHVCAKCETTSWLNTCIYDPTPEEVKAVEAEEKQREETHSP